MTATPGSATWPSASRHVFDERGIEIAHLKVTLSPADKSSLAVLNQVRNEHRAELSHESIGLLSDADLLFNLRAEGNPEALLAATLGALEDAAGAAGIRHQVRHVEHFRPGQPTPTHRSLAGLRSLMYRRPRFMPSTSA